MGLLGRYIDSLPEPAKDRVIEAQHWCVAEVLGPAGTARCLVGHAEDWTPLAARLPWWRRWMDDGASGTALAAADPAVDAQLEPLCAPGFFTFRRAYPADMAVYLRRVQRWGVSSEGHIGARFDRLCARCGLESAVRLVKLRAARGSEVAARPGGARPGAGAHAAG
jgi:hypothetical protein